MEEDCFQRADGVELRSIAGEDFLIVLHAGESKLFSLNGMGLWFWTHLEQPVSPSGLRAAMLAEYDVSEAAATAEIARFLRYLEEKALARRV